MTLPLPLHSVVALLARIRRIPFSVLAAAVCVLFVAVGVVVLGDYGVSSDELAQRNIAIGNANYIMGDGDALPTDHNRFYSIIFELPLLLVERVLDLQDSRDIFLARHLLTHLFFIVGGFFCGLLVYRMMGSRWAGVLAMLLFLLHPRLYAHSFINSKDIPFLVMFIIALYLTHRAFRRDTVGAFALLGVVVGLAVNMRPFALLLPPAILAMRGLDWRFASSSHYRKGILVTVGGFTAAVLLAIYVSHPHYWENPLRFIEGIQAFSQHPVLAVNLFQGELGVSYDAPPQFIPVWFGITTPLLALLLGAGGAAAVLWRGIRTPGRILGRGELRFLFLLLGCLALPVVVAIVLQSPTYNDWRHMYFLWAPFCPLAVAGCGPLPSFLGKGNFPALIKGGISYNRLRRIIVYGVASASLAGAMYAIVSLHPHQQVYFNLLVNRAAPGELGRQYEMDYWGTPHLQGLEYLLERYPDGVLYVLDADPTFRNRMILPARERERIVLSDGWDADFHIRSNRDIKLAERAPVIYELRAYNSVYIDISIPRLVWGAGLSPSEDVYRAAHQVVAAAGPPAARARFDVYISDGALYYVKGDCVPVDTGSRFFLHYSPVDGDDLPAERREYGFDNRDFEFIWRGGFFDGKCITQEQLPDYPIARISTGQYISGGERLWKTEINAAVFMRFQELEAGLGSWQPAAEGVFDVYLDGGTVIYYKDSCVAADTEARFVLHVYPVDANNLPADRREYGFVNLNFDFGQHGIRRDGKCLAAVPMPGYEIARIRAGQYTPDRGRLWEAVFAMGGGDGGR